MTPVLAHAAATDIGLQRTTNEDAYLVQPPLFVVADGLGGHVAGEVASRLAIETLSAYAGDGHEALAEAVREANRSVHEQALSDLQLHGMGTTLTALLAADSSIQIAHVGDSRAYLLRDDELRRLTQDHTLAERLAREGRISADEADRHPQRSILERAVGVGPEVEVDVYAIDILPGDRLLLCTDGLTSMLSDPEIRAVLAGERDPKSAADRLVAEAVRAGGRDNVTTLVVDYPEAVAGSQDPGQARPESAQARPESAQARPEGAPILTPASMAKPATPASKNPAPPPPPDVAPLPEAARPPRRAMMIAMLVLVVAGGGLASRWALSNSWYVGSEAGMVAIYRGIPGSFGGIKLRSLEQQTDIPVSSLSEVTRRRLEEGITAGDRTRAGKIVRDIRERATLSGPSPLPEGARPAAPPPAPPPTTPTAPQAPTAPASNPPS